MVGPDQYSIERLEERPWLKIMLLCYRKYRVLEIIFVGARIYDACQLKNGLSLFPFDLHGTSRYRFDLSCPIDSFLQPVLKTLIVSIDLIAISSQPLYDEFVLLALRGDFDQVHEKFVRDVSSWGSRGWKVPDVFVQSPQPRQLLRVF